MVDIHRCLTATAFDSGSPKRGQVIAFEGMPGVGKTTLVHDIYNKLSTRYKVVVVPECLVTTHNCADVQEYHQAHAESREYLTSSLIRRSFSVLMDRCRASNIIYSTLLAGQDLSASLYAEAERMLYSAEWALRFDMLVVMRLDMNCCWSRRRQLTETESAVDMDPGFFARLYNAYELFAGMADELYSDTKVIVLDANRPRDQLVATLIGELTI